MADVLVLGASGYIGTHLVPHLLAVGRRVRATARHIEALEAHTWGTHVDLCRADILDPESLDVALSGIEIVYYLVHCMGSGRGFAERERRGAHYVATACRRAGVRRIVYLGGLLPKRNPSEHLRARRTTGEVLATSGVAVLEARAGMIIGPGSAAFEVMRDSVSHLPLVLAPAWVASRSQPVALDEVLDWLRAAAYRSLTIGHTVVELAGPEVLSYGDMSRRLAHRLGCHPLFVPLPRAIPPALFARCLPLVTTVPTPLASALLAGVGQDILADQPEPGFELDFNAALERAFERERQRVNAHAPANGYLLYRAQQPRNAWYALRAGATLSSSASLDALWQQICLIGGRRGYYYLNGLWWLRMALDWLVGGPSFRRTRRDDAALQVGEVLDAWRVLHIAPHKRLLLALEMRVPGSGVLEFVLRPEAEGTTRIEATAHFYPRGFWGLLYWYPLVPFHGILFRGLVRALHRRAQQIGSPK